MKLVQYEHVQRAPNKVTFVVSSQMTRLDVKNYLEKIYNVPVMDVHTTNVSGEEGASGGCHLIFSIKLLFSGKTHMHKLQFIWKEDDHKLAFVTLVNKSNNIFIF